MKEPWSAITYVDFFMLSLWEIIANFALVIIMTY